MAKFITESSLGISVSPANIRPITGLQDPYKWVFLPEKRYLFEKHLSKHCIGVYREIYVGVGEAFEAVLTDASNNETHPSVEIQGSSARDDFGSRGCEKACRHLHHYDPRMDETKSCTYGRTRAVEADAAIKDQ
jgi:hypothetical protein